MAILPFGGVSSPCFPTRDSWLTPAFALATDVGDDPAATPPLPVEGVGDADGAVEDAAITLDTEGEEPAAPADGIGVFGREWTSWMTSVPSTSLLLRIQTNVSFIGMCLKYTVTYLYEMDAGLMFSLPAPCTMQDSCGLAKFQNLILMSVPAERTAFRPALRMLYIEVTLDVEGWNNKDRGLSEWTSLIHSAIFHIPQNSIFRQNDGNLCGTCELQWNLRNLNLTCVVESSGAALAQSTSWRNWLSMFQRPTSLFP